MSAVETAGLEDMSAHLLPRRKSWAPYGKTWIMHQQWREGQSQTDYLLGTDRLLFQNASIWDPWHILDHFMVLGCIYGAAQWEHPPLPPLMQATREDH